MSTHRDDAPNPWPHYVYRCYDAAEQLLYVGCTEDVDSRMFHHLHQCNSWKQPNGTLRRHMARYEVTEYPTRFAARQGERQAIAEGRPLLNKQHNPARFTKAGGKGFRLVEPVHPMTAAAFPDLAERETA